MFERVSTSFWGGAVGVVGVPTVLLGLGILSEQGRNSPWGWLAVAFGSLCCLGCALIFLLSPHDRGGGLAPKAKAEAGNRGRAFAAGGDLTIRDYYEARPESEERLSDRVAQTIRDLTQIRFELGPNRRQYSLTDILVISGERLAAPTPEGTFQATIQNAIPPPDSPIDHKDVPPEILSELVLHEVLTCERVVPGGAQGGIRPLHLGFPYNTYRLTSLGKGVVRELRSNQSSNSRLARRTERLAAAYSEGKRLLLLEPDSAWPRTTAELGGLLRSDVIDGEFRTWDIPVQQFIYEEFGSAHATLYGNSGFPKGDGTTFDVVRARLAYLESLLVQSAEKA